MSLEQWIALRDAPMKEIRSRFAIDDAHVDRNTSYGRLGPLTELHDAKIHPARFYFDGETPVLIYVDDAAALARCDAAELLERLGKPAAELRSRAGKTFTHYVYPAAGIAFSAHRQEIAYVEVFPPCSLQDYLDRIYVDPGVFTK
ncbi:MAG: hypothetical protein JNK68_03465 [Betaproteobacteria bacterium]|nr:hypothetical protein [Betaproteobacteria bacterium]